jgi:hypothetical protein
MTDLYLIAHKVRGEPAFDVAQRMTCPCCEGDRSLSNGIIDITGDDGMVPCHECDSLGYWWIIPTSGHRAYPYWHAEFDGLHFTSKRSSNVHPIEFEALVDAIPPTLPDHYRTREEPNFNLTEALGLKPRKLPPIIRRL